MADINIILNSLKNRIAELIVENAILQAELEESKRAIDIQAAVETTTDTTSQ